MKKLFKKLHKWLAIPVGIIISVTCLTGAILVFQDEILEFANPKHYFVDEGDKKQAIPLDELVPMVNAKLDSNSVASVKIPSDPNRTYTMTLKEGFRVSAFVNPYTGEITGYYKFRENPFFTVMSIHRWLMDGSRTTGKYAVGISTLLFVIILITGFILWVPREWKKSRFKIQFRKGRKRLMFDLHNVLGAYACLVLLICALSGLMWSFDWYRSGVFGLFGAEDPRGGRGGGHGQAQNQQGRGEGRGQQGGDKKERKEINTASWEKVYTTLVGDNPENQYIRIENGKAAVRQKYMANARATDEYIFDRKGEITESKLYNDQASGSKIWGWTYSLHVGSYWGIWSKIFTFIASLIGASLPITGYYLFIKKRKKKKKSH